MRRRCQQTSGQKRLSRRPSPAKIKPQVLGGILFILDSGLGATLLLGFLLPTTAIMHDFWNVRDKEAAQIEQIMFMKVRARLVLCFRLPWRGPRVTLLSAAAHSDECNSAVGGLLVFPGR